MYCIENQRTTVPRKKLLDRSPRIQEKAHPSKPLYHPAKKQIDPSFRSDTMPITNQQTNQHRIVPKKIKQTNPLVRYSQIIKFVAVPSHNYNRLLADDNAEIINKLTFEELRGLAHGGRQWRVMRDLAGISLSGIFTGSPDRGATWRRAQP